MPFKTTRELPREAKKLPAGARKVWMAAFTKAMQEKPEEIAAEAAFAKVKKLFKQEGENWIPLKKGEDPDFKSKGLAPDDPRLDPDSDEYDPVYDPDSDEYDPEVAEAESEEGGEEDPDALDPDEVEEDPDALEEEDPDEEDDPDEDLEEEDPEEELPDPAGEAESEASQAEEIAAVARARAKHRAKIRAKAEMAGDSDMQTTELFALDAKGFRLTADGYLVAAPRVSRTGIQLYKGSEVGRPDLDVVRVYRPEDEVFSIAAMGSLAHRPITLEHPTTPVDSSNWRELAIGKSDGEVARDGDFIRVPLVLMDAHGIAAAQSGKSQLSVGYGAKLVWGAGQAPDGQLYDAMQTEIRANHIALVSAARGGDKLKIGDRKWKSKGNHHGTNQRSRIMIEKMLDGVTIELDDKDAQILQRHLDAQQKQAKDQSAEVDALKAQIAELQAKLAEAMKRAGTTDGEIAALKAKVEDSALTPDRLDKALSLRMEVVDRATGFFGDTKYQWTGKSDQQIRRDVVAARLGDAKAKVMNDDAIEGAFLSITEPETQDGFSRMTQSFSRPPAGNFGDRAAQTYDKRNEELANRYKKNRRSFGVTA